MSARSVAVLWELHGRPLFVGGAVEALEAALVASATHRGARVLLLAGKRMVGHARDGALFDEAGRFVARETFLERLEAPTPSPVVDEPRAAPTPAPPHRERDEATAAAPVERKTSRHLELAGVVVHGAHGRWVVEAQIDGRTVRVVAARGSARVRDLTRGARVLVRVDSRNPTAGLLVAAAD